MIIAAGIKTRLRKRIYIFVCLGLNKRSPNVASRNELGRNIWDKMAEENKSGLINKINKKNHVRNTEHRRVTSKFRIGNPNLKIETGRFTIPKT